ncbi:MAG TPA: universal stress protein [Spirochaetia bacterium]|nr:universal stress protein [Spirochaetia bacterium]
MIEQLAVGIDGSHASFEALDQAIMVAKRLQSALKCVFVVDSRKTQVPIVYSGGAFDISTERIYLPLDPNLREYYGKIAEDLREFGANCLRFCAKRAGDSDLKITTIVREGYPAAELCEECRSADILIVGQKGENAHYKRSIVGSTTEDLVRTSPRPVQVVPVHRESLDRVMFVYDGSRTAENALRFYVNALGNVARSFEVALVSDDQSVALPDEEIEFLKQHGVPVELPNRDRVSLDSVLQGIETRGTDMILVGAYGRKKMLELILGSTASRLIRRSTVPVLVVY